MMLTIYSLTNLKFTITVVTLILIWLYIMLIKKAPIIIRGSIVKKKEKFLFLCVLSLVAFIFTGTVSVIAALIGVCGSGK